MRSNVLLGAVVLLTLGAAAVAVAADGAAGIAGPATLADALAQAKAQNRQLVLDFYADW